MDTPPTDAPGSRRPDRRFGRVLDPADRVAEVLFGLIMVLTFTGSLSVAEADRNEVRTMLIGALGCNLAWGIIDAVLYLMGRMAERGGALRALRAVRRATNPAEAQRLIEDALPQAVAAVLTPAEVEAIRLRLKDLPEPARGGPLSLDDWLGGLGVFLWVFLTTFPVAIPFLVMDDAGPALRVSNGVGVAMLLVTGYVFGRCAGRNPWLTGGAMLVIGGALVAMTIALGG
jgi:hypothetical protein